MASRCKKIKFKEKRKSKPVVAIKKLKTPSTRPASSDTPSDDMQLIFTGEGEYEDIPYVFESSKRKSGLQYIREWVEKQRFIPQDLSDNFLNLFLTAGNNNVELATKKIEKYFKSRQEPVMLFRNRDPLSPENVKIFKKLYVLPMPDTTEDGKKIILTGLLEPMVNYNQMDHAKALALVFDLLIWEKDIGFGDFVIVLDGRGFTCPQLLEYKINQRRLIKCLLLDTIPGTLKSFYFLYPPSHVANVADSRNEIWITVVKSKQEMISHLPADILPLEFGGNLGHLGDLLEQWDLHMVHCRDFFINFEQRMIKDYRRKLCYENEVKQREKNWVHQMKLVADEWEYKIQYYERMKHMSPFKHPAFGRQRLLIKPKAPISEDPLKKCRQKAKEEAERAKIFEPSLFYNGYAKEIRKAQLEAEREQMAEIEGEGGEEGPFTAPPLITTEEEQASQEVWQEEEGAEEKSDTEPEIDFQRELMDFNHWLEREPYLPKNIDEEVLITFLWDSASVEEAENKLMNYYYAKQSLRPVFHERHPCSPNNLLKYDAVCVVPLTSGLDKKWIIFATWLSHEDPTKFSIYHMMKLIFTELDILLQENQIRGKTISVIIDMEGYSEEHTAMITKFAAQRICYLFTQCFPCRFNGFYILNAPEHVADYTMLFKPFDFHIVECVEDLAGFLPIKFLPSDMGGLPENCARDSYFEPFFKRMRRCGNWLAYEEFIRSQEMMLRITTTREEFSYGIFP